MAVRFGNATLQKWAAPRWDEVNDTRIMCVRTRRGFRTSSDALYLGRNSQQVNTSDENKKKSSPGKIHAIYKVRVREGSAARYYYPGRVGKQEFACDIIVWRNTALFVNKTARRSLQTYIHRRTRALPTAPRFHGVFSGITHSPGELSIPGKRYRTWGATN